MGGLFSAPIAMDKNKLLGKGTYGDVYLGTLIGEEIAVKVIKLSQLEEREVEFQSKLSHENVLKILAATSDSNFSYVALELCAGTLMNVVDKTYQGPTLPSDKEVVHQMIKGLHYIHSQQLIHRDIKPENILISKKAPATIKLSDFGLCKQMSCNETFSMSGIKGTFKWMAPEMLKCLTNEIPPDAFKGSSSNDIFSTGCVIFFYVTRGTHPFGNGVEVPVNIVNNKPDNISIGNQFDQLLIGIAGDMIKHHPNERMSLKNALEKLKKS